MEPDFHRHLGERCIVSTARIFLEHVTREAETRMLERDLPEAVKQVASTAPDLVVFGCTSAGALGALAHDDGIRQKIEAAASARTVTVLRSVITQLEAIRPRRLAVLTPYVDDLTRGIADSLAEAGYAPVKAAGMGIRANLEIGRVPSADIIRFVEAQIAAIRPDCIFLSCTNWQAVETIGPLHAKFQIPVITSNQAAVEAVRAAIGAP